LPRRHALLPFLIGLHVIACCISLACVSSIYPPYHLIINWTGLPVAIPVTSAFAMLSVLFVIADFSVGYFLGFYFYTMILGYLWLNCFSEFKYDHFLTGVSAAASAVAFLLPALFIKAPIRQVWALSPPNFDRLLNAILVSAAAIFVFGAIYNFRPVGFFRMISLDGDVPALREQLVFPTVLNYLIGIASSAALPFAFACFIERKGFGRAALVLGLLLFVYPITLTKMALFSAVWIALFSLVARFIDTKTVVVLSLAVPIGAGIALFTLFAFHALSAKAFEPYFSLVNFRFMTIPSMAMDYYNEFFSKNPLTHFCQINLLKRFMSCPYDDPLAIVIYKAFGIGGNFNASLFATEGIASVGPKLAPLSALLAGLVIAFANRLSAGLPPRLILASSAVLVQMMLNVPLTISLASYGGALLFLLWYITPRSIFAQGEAAVGSSGS
jgi:hypothetical protein